jgi:hypothetical protein
MNEMLTTEVEQDVESFMIWTFEFFSS